MLYLYQWKMLSLKDRAVSYIFPYSKSEPAAPFLHISLGQHIIFRMKPSFLADKNHILIVSFYNTGGGVVVGWFFFFLLQFKIFLWAAITTILYLHHCIKETWIPQVTKSFHSHFWFSTWMRILFFKRDFFFLLIFAVFFYFFIFKFFVLFFFYWNNKKTYHILTQ